MSHPRRSVGTPAVALAAHLEHADVPDARHIWMPSQRSLCELAVRRFVASEEEAIAAHEASRGLPACGACLFVTEMLQKSAKYLKGDPVGAVTPSRTKVLELLGRTTWTWTTSPLIGPKEGSQS